MLSDKTYELSAIEATINDNAVLLASGGLLDVEVTSIPSQAMGSRKTGQGCQVKVLIPGESLLFNLEDLPDLFNISFDLEGKRIAGVVGWYVEQGNLVLEHDSIRLQVIAAHRG